MSLDSIRKPLPKASAAELEERRRQARATLPTTKSPERALPRYLRGSLGQAAAPERAREEEAAAAVPRYLQGGPGQAAPATAPSTPAAGDLGPAEPLAPEVASRFSQAYGQDLSRVRVHPDSPRAEALGARALAVGNDIAFAPGAYQPSSPDGQRLIGHELAHVVQQTGRKPTVQGKGLSSDSPEQEADRAAEAAVAGEEVPPLSSVGGETVQLKAADAPTAAPAPAAGNKVQPGEIDLSQARLDPATVQVDKRGRARARLGGLAEGEIELEKRGDAYRTRGQGQALPLNLGPLAPVLGDSLVLVVRVDNNVISGHAAVGRPGRAVPRGDSALFRAIEKNPEALGWAGLSKLSVGTTTNALEGGALKLGSDSMRFTLGGFVEGSGRFSVEGDKVSFSGLANVKLPGASEGRLEVAYSPQTGLAGEAQLNVGLGKVSGGVGVRLRQGFLDIQGTVGYSGDRLKGSITLLATDAKTAEEITRNPPAIGALPGQAGSGVAGAGGLAGADAAAAAKPGPRAFCGWGELDFALTDWLTGRVMVVVNNQGEATVQGEIAPPREIILFEQKDWTKSLVKVEARAAYGVPVVGNVFVFANIGLEALASIGPGKLYNIKLAGQYSTDKKADKELSLTASLNISAFAGLRLRAEGGAGLELAGHDLKFGVGLWALAGVRGYVDATPTIGYREKGGGPGEFYIKGHMELAAQPFLGLGGDLFIELDAPWWSPLSDDKWTWPLGSIEYPLPGEFGIGADVEHVMGSKQWPEVKFSEVDFDSSRFMSDLLSQSAPARSKGGEEKKPAKWNDGGATDTRAVGPGGPAGGKAPAAAPPAAGGKKGPSVKPKAGNAKPGEPKGGKPAGPGKLGKPKDQDKKPGKPKDKKPPKIGEAVPFSGGGVTHRLWIVASGRKPVVMVASTPAPAETQIARMRADAAKLTDAKKQARSKELLDAAQSQLDRTKAAAQKELQVETGGAGGGGDSASASAVTVAEEKRLASTLGQAFGFFGKHSDEVDAPKKLEVTPPADMGRVQTELSPKLYDVRSKTSLLKRPGDPKVHAYRLTTQHPDSVTYQKDSGTLKLPPPQPAPLQAATTPTELATLAADHSHVTGVTFIRDERKFELHGTIGTASAVLAKGRCAVEKRLEDAVGGDLIPFLLAMAEHGAAGGLTLAQLVDLCKSGVNFDWLKDKFRDVKPFGEHHEWIPSNLMVEVVKHANQLKSVVGFVKASRWIRLQNEMRTDTGWVIFKPKYGKLATDEDGMVNTVLQGHAGAVYLEDKGKRTQQITNQPAFHDALRDCFTNNIASIPACIDAIIEVFDEYVWKGEDPGPSAPLHPRLVDGRGRNIRANQAVVAAEQLRRWQQLLKMFLRMKARYGS